MIRTSACGALMALTFAAAAVAADYHAVQLNSPLPAGAVSPEIAAALQPSVIKVTKGDSQVVCEIWLANEWPIAADAKAGGEILYPLSPGQLIGVIRYPRKAADFRDQEIPMGTFVLRYAQQPVDGAHVGTSPTRDFLALLPAAKDRDPQTIDYKTLTTTSKETSGTAHPAILSLQGAAADDKSLSVREDTERQWVVVHLLGKAREGGAVRDMPVELVVVGKTAE
jgi:hypothetical protein